MREREWRQKLYTKRMAALHIAALAVIVFAIWIGFGPLNDIPFLICSCAGSGAAAVLAIAYIRILRLDALEALKPVCGLLLVLILACPIPHMIPETWPYHPQVWVRGTRGLASLIVIGLAVFYFIKTRKQGRHKAGMVICLVFGILLCIACLTTTAF
ncbi:hypothetical protein [Christensenella tenuis]|jgi:hypothetical protein|uniref:Uncharacterized protein n=1 Tax=Christensenella tenuis TaxID=2763033 RepID=A0ABR7EFL6_9FIRM|nr:hypothetical protein [Christensenella tenuis]MBC5648560.1 hypothetical protein [Christensenella tenuis]